MESSPGSIHKVPEIASELKLLIAVKLPFHPYVINILIKVTGYYLGVNKIYMIKRDRDPGDGCTGTESRCSATIKLFVLSIALTVSITGPLLFTIALRTYPIRHTLLMHSGDILNTFLMNG